MAGREGESDTQRCSACGEGRGRGWLWWGDTAKAGEATGGLNLSTAGRNPPVRQPRSRDTPSQPCLLRCLRPSPALSTLHNHTHTPHTCLTSALPAAAATDAFHLAA